MANWSGRIRETADARGVWMRSSSLIEHIPSFPGVITDSGTDVVDPGIDEVLATSEASFQADGPETEITDTTSAPLSGTLNRGAITDPPVPRRTHAPPQPERLRLLDEGPDPAEETPPTWDMGLLPATYADAEITENNRGTDVEATPRWPTDAPSDVDIDLDASMHAATLQADQEASITLDMELLSPGERDALGFDTPQQDLRDVPSLGGQRPLPSPRPLRTHMRTRSAPNARVPGHNRSSATSATGAPERSQRPATRASISTRDDFATQAPTRPRVPVHMRSIPVIDERSVVSGPTLFERAGWWTAGALAGMIGASVLASMALAIVFLI
jgi:hypothetical protein